MLLFLLASGIYLSGGDSQKKSETQAMILRKS